MRYNITKKHSTKTERIVYEVLKEFKLPFRHRWLIGGYEIDFVVGNVCLEINGHEQNTTKNNHIVSLGYKLIHLTNQEVNREYITKLIKHEFNKIIP